MLKSDVSSYFQIFSHHKCATSFSNQFLRYLSKANGIPIRHSHTGRFDHNHIKHDASLISLSNAFYPHLADPWYSGVHIVRNPLALVSSAYFSHLNVHPVDGWPLLAAQRKRLAGLSKEEGIWATIKFLELDEFYPDTAGPLKTLASWDYSDPRFVMVRMEDLVKAPKEILIKALTQLDHSQAEVFSTFQFPPKENFSFEAISGGRKIGEVDDTSHWRSGNPQDYKNHLTDEQTAFIREKYDFLLEEYYPN